MNIFAHNTFFIAICFFSIGFLSLVGFVSFYLNFFFKSKVYHYYSGYVFSILLFIVLVFIKNTGDYPRHTLVRNTFEILVDILQMISIFMFFAFIYHNMINENEKFKKLKKLFQFFSGFTLLYIAIAVCFPIFVIKSFPFFIASRIIVILFSLSVYFVVIKELKVVYFRYLFMAITFLFLFGFLALWDSTVNIKTSIYTGFQYLCVGYFMENICFVGAFIYKYSSTEKAKKEGEIKHEMELFATQMEIQEQTMHHIGREIHDNIGQKLTLASLYTQQLGYENKAPQVNDSIKNISEIIDESLTELRELSKSLTNNNITGHGISELLALECEKIKKLKICAVRYTSQVENLLLPYSTKNVLLRITQEFIQNSIKHSQCDSIVVSLSVKNETLKLKLEDDGSGFDQSNLTTNGIGLENIKKRTEIINGEFHLQSNTNGTKLTITIPLKP